ncbi:hypothetical protein F5Y18DRAFT_424128 [Xylariaceae sp. FL1019]|nr:hypothetical protein F5Y18DRAFT_424128 [Xylariaceae sp. FL1019]
MATLSDEAIRQEWDAAAALVGPWSWCVMLSTAAFDSLGRWGRDYYIAQSSTIWGPTAYYHDGVTPGMMILTSNRWLEFRSIYIRHSVDSKYPTLFPPGIPSHSAGVTKSKNEKSVSPDATKSNKEESASPDATKSNIQESASVTGNTGYEAPSDACTAVENVPAHTSSSPLVPTPTTMADETLAKDRSREMTSGAMAAERAKED